MTVLGLMSGTSVDAVDACLVCLSSSTNGPGNDTDKVASSGKLDFEILATHTRPMPDPLRARLLRAMADKHIELEELCALNVVVGELFAETALELLQSHGLPPAQVDCIGSHGQTLYHWPPPPSQAASGRLGGTLQIGEPAIIAEKTGIDTIADFRPGDMAAGGQGAPLVCFADCLLFEDAHMGRCIQNIGGIANVTVVPAKTAREQGQSALAFDTGPGNMLMDAAMTHFYGRPYDENGATAASGALHAPLLEYLLAHSYLRCDPPKTTGREDFGEAFFRELPARFPGISPADWLATLAHYTAQSIVEAYERFIFPRYAVGEMIIGGGGARNAFLLTTLGRLFRERGRAIALKTHADFGIPDQYKEALAFAILAWAARTGRPNNVPECTGATHPVILGKFLAGSAKAHSF
jgi:anhydro-N-acetylmuramic acid kinase